jgi:hypothetical protein
MTLDGCVMGLTKRQSGRIRCARLAKFFSVAFGCILSA